MCYILPFLFEDSPFAIVFIGSILHMQTCKNFWIVDWKICSLMHFLSQWLTLYCYIKLVCKSGQSAIWSSVWPHFVALLSLLTVMVSAYGSFDCNIAKYKGLFLLLTTIFQTVIFWEYCLTSDFQIALAKIRFYLPKGER